MIVNVMENLRPYAIAVKAALYVQLEKAAIYVGIKINHAPT